MPHVKLRKGWDWVPEREVTPESTYMDRRRFLEALGLGAAALGPLLSGCSEYAASPALAEGSLPSPHIPEAWVRQWADLFPALRNEKFKQPREVTPESLVTGFNNFYEFTLVKEKVKEFVEEFEVHPWEVEITGEVEKKGRFDLDELVRMGTLEERIYHFRCVEAWSANVPFTGFPFSRLAEKVQPTDKARYVRFVTIYKPNQMPGQRTQRQYPWPYYEALTLEEAMNELALLTFGIYGHPLNKQNGAPVRMILPWKYGFKSIKSIVKIEFVRKQPGTLWGDISREYGFWANVNPRFDHPRWSQATEIFLNTQERIPTKLYNGYGEYVAHLYDANDRQYFY